MPLKFHRCCLSPLNRLPSIALRPYKRRVTKTPSLSTASTPAPISHPHVRNHLSIGAPPAVSIEHRRVAIFVAPPPSGVISEIPRRPPLSLSPIYHDDLLIPRAAAPPHGHEATMEWVSTMVPWSINPIHDFFYKKTILKNLRKC
jgi:hypothetical protein